MNSNTIQLYSKAAQYFNSQQQSNDQTLFGGNMGGKTLTDLYQQIMMDSGLQADQRYQTIAQVRAMTNNAPPSTPLSALMAGGLGAAIGWIVAKYFNMTTLGKAVSSILGYGLGTQLNHFMDMEHQMGVY